MKLRTIFIAQIFWAFYSCTGDKAASLPKIQPEKIKVELTLQQKVFSNSIDSLASKRHKQGIFNGVILVAEYGLPIYSKAFGYSNFKTKELLTEHSVFQLASVSKMFTATAILLLQQKGFLSVNDSVRHIIPDFPYEGLIIRHLLTHRSGLPRYMVVTDVHWPRDSMLTNEDMHSVMVANPPKRYFSPDFRFNYQNTNYAYLALIVERVSGKSFDNFVRDHIFEPLGMYNSRVYSGSSLLSPSSLLPSPFFSPSLFFSHLLSPSLVNRRNDPRRPYFIVFHRRRKQRLPIGRPNWCNTKQSKNTKYVKDAGNTGWGHRPTVYTASDHCWSLHLGVVVFIWVL